MTEYVKDMQYDEYTKSLNDIINNITFLAVPIMAGVFLNAELIIELIAGEQYILATASLRILTMTIFFAVLGGALAYCVNLPLKKERLNLLCTSISAVENMILNGILIPVFKTEGAAIATFISEFSVMIILMLGMKKYSAFFHFKSIFINTIKCFISIFPFALISGIMETRNLSQILSFPLIVIFSVSAYLIMNFILKNECLISYFNRFKRFPS